MHIITYSLVIMIINEGFCGKKAYMAFLADFPFLQDQAYFSGLTCSDVKNIIQ